MRDSKRTLIKNRRPQGGHAVVTFTPQVQSICPVTSSCTPPSGSEFPKGTTTVTCTATNAAGSTSCSFTITVNDKEPPMINCPADVTQANDPGQCGAIVNYPPPTVTDNCPGATAVCSPASGSFFPVGTTMVTCTATDASGNTSTCTFNVTVIRTGPPCPPANFTVF